MSFPKKKLLVLISICTLFFIVLCSVIFFSISHTPLPLFSHNSASENVYTSSENLSIQPSYSIDYDKAKNLLPILKYRQSNVSVEKQSKPDLHPTIVSKDAKGNIMLSSTLSTNDNKTIFWKLYINPEYLASTKTLSEENKKKRLMNINEFAINALIIGSNNLLNKYNGVEAILPDFKEEFEQYTIITLPS